MSNLWKDCIVVAVGQEPHWTYFQFKVCAYKAGLITWFIKFFQCSLIHCYSLCLWILAFKAFYGDLKYLIMKYSFDLLCFHSVP